MDTDRCVNFCNLYQSNNCIVRFAAVPTAHMRLLVLDDMSQADAKQYFLNKIPADKMSLFKSDCDSFDSVYSMTGGRIVFLDQYVNDVILKNTAFSGKIRPYE